MTSLLLGEAFDLSAVWAPHATVGAGALIEPTPTTPVVPPGDPDEEWVPSPAGPGRVVTVSLYRAVTLEHIGDIASAEVTDWSEDVDFLEATDAGIEASSFDPIWAAASVGSFIGADGRRKHSWDAKGYVATVFVDGRADKVVMFRQPLDIGAGRVRLPTQGPEAVYSERFVGAVEQPDLLEGWGDFEGVPLGQEPPGLVKIPKPGQTIEAEVVLDAVRGTRCLQVTGRGWVRTPKVTLMGGDGVKPTVTVAAFGKWASNLDDRDHPAILTYVQRTDSLAPSELEYTYRQAGVVTDAGEGWTMDPVGSGARMSAQVVAHRVWGELRSFDTPTRYDVVTMRQGRLTGFVVPRDLSRIIQRLVRDLDRPSVGGSPTGFTVAVDGLCGTEIVKTWPHDQHLPALDAFAEILERDDGPELWVDGNWVLHIAPRRGGDRPDLTLSVDQVLEWRWAVDPGAEVDDYVVDTGRGSGTNLVTVTVSQPVRPSRHRIARITRPPRKMGLNATGDWGRHHARAAARRQVTATVQVPWTDGERFNLGDCFWAVMEDGNLGEQAWVRLVRRRKLPGPALHELTLALVGADA